ncbi:MAG: alpha/beta hydrolase [Candidatus Heimdallarchaeota archaeon]
MKKKALGSFSIVLLFVVFTPVLALKVDDGEAEFYLNPKVVQENRVEAFNTLLFDLAGFTDNATKMIKINEFMAEQQPYGFPVTHNDKIVFIYRTNNTLQVEIDGRMTGQVPLEHIEGTDFFHKQFTFYNDSQGGYGFREDGGSMLKDPLNPDTLLVGIPPQFIVVSNFQMPEYTDDGAYLFSDTTGSVMLNETIFSTKTNHNYTINIYLPAGYNDSQTQRYKSVYVADGELYAYAWKARNTLDYLDFYNKIDPLIGVFITPVDFSLYRNNDLTDNRKDHADFIVEELMPYIDSNYRTFNDSTARAHLGSSHGGFFSLYLGAEYSDFFKLIGAHSPSQYASQYLKQLFTDSSKVDGMRFYLNGGTYEQGILNHAYSISEILAEKGYAGKFRAFHQAHAAGQWRATLGELLTFLFTDEASDYSGSPIMFGNIEIPSTTTTTTTNPETTSFGLTVPFFGLMILILVLQRKNSIFRITGKRKEKREG